MSFYINIQRRLIFAGILFGAFAGLILYLGQENLLNTFPQVWIIPDWVLWGLVIAFVTAFVDVIIVAVLIGVVLVLVGWFVFIGAYLVPLPVLYHMFIPQTNSIQLKAIVYFMYAVVLFWLSAPFIIHWHYRRQRGEGMGISMYSAMVFAFIGAVIAVSLGIHYSAYFISYFVWIYGHLVWFIPVCIGIVWLLYFLITGDILIYEQIDTRKHNRNWKEDAYQTGWREAENHFHREQEANENNGRGREKELTNVEQGVGLNLEEVGRMLNLWQQKYAKAEGNMEKMKEANEKLLFYTDLVKKLKNRKGVIK